MILRKEKKELVVLHSLTTNGLVAMLLGFTEGSLREIRNEVWDADARNLGRSVMGDVAGRDPTEDVEVGIDKICQSLFLRRCQEMYKQHGVTLWVFSEHNQQGLGVGCERREDADIECYIDPFDGSDQYLKGIREAWWSVCSFCQNGVPLVGGAVDILGGTLYLARPGRVEKISIRLNRREQVSPRKEISLGGESVVASYKGKWRYFFPWVGRVRRLFRQPELAGVTHYGNGGSFVYALLAGGVLSAYIMDRTPGEPISEISPGAGFVEAAGLSLLVVKRKSVMRFDPVAGMEGRVKGIFIAACTEDLGQWIAAQLQT